MSGAVREVTLTTGVVYRAGDLFRRKIGTVLRICTGELGDWDSYKDVVNSCTTYRHYH
jgi:hypothetical protein